MKDTAMNSILQIFKVNEARSGEKDGRKWSIQECECALLSPDGVVEQVGVLSLPRELVDKTAPRGLPWIVCAEARL